MREHVPPSAVQGSRIRACPPAGQDLADVEATFGLIGHCLDHGVGDGGAVSLAAMGGGRVGYVVIVVHVVDGTHRNGIGPHGLDPPTPVCPRSVCCSRPLHVRPCKFTGVGTLESRASSPLSSPYTALLPPLSQAEYEALR